jgi:hypothetical protein
MKQLKTKIMWKINVKWRTLRSYHSCVRGVWTSIGVDSLGWDSGQGEDVSLLQDVQTGSGAHPASYTVSTGGSFAGEETLSNLWVFLYNDVFNFSSSFIFYRIPRNAGYFG